LVFDAPELKNRTASSGEEQGVVAPEHYEIQTKIDDSASLASIASVRFKAKVDGARVVPFDLVTSLRVSRVTGEGGRPCLSFKSLGRKTLPST
jgi:hypothetical protein